VINVGSVAGFIAADKGSPYTSTKHALEGLSDAWRRELAEDKISVSLIQPGFIASKMCKRKVCDDAYLPDFSKAVMHAVESPYPQTRYPVAGVVVMPAWLAVWFDAIIPDRIADAIVNTVARKAGVSADTAASNL
jgi:short-subunit dehydrogenase